MISIVIVICVTVAACFAMSLYAAHENTRALKIACELSEHLRDEAADIVRRYERELASMIKDAETEAARFAREAEKHAEDTKKVLLEHNERLMHIEHWKAKQGMR